jgi:DNA-binding PadR family transcriptional regulator
MQINDLQELSKHQILLLLLVSYGLTTPYDLLSKAGLGVGQTSPSLKRMKQDGLLNDFAGARNSTSYALTTEGKEALRRVFASGPSHSQQQFQSDTYESLPRAIILAWLNSGPDEARNVISEARAALGRLAEKRQLAIEGHQRQIDFVKSAASSSNTNAGQGMLVAATLQWLKAEFDRELFQLQEKALERLTGLVEGLPAAPPLPAEK